VTTTVVPALAVDWGVAEALTPVHWETSVYWLELYASHVPEPLPAVPELLVSRVQTEMPYVPGAAPLVFQAKVEVVEYAWTRCQLLAPGFSIQN
jgi:hypothetical protein